MRVMITTAVTVSGAALAISRIQVPTFVWLTAPFVLVGMFVAVSLWVSRKERRHDDGA